MNSQIVDFLGENCTSNCTDTCGFQCLALCNLTCSIGEDTYDVDNNNNDTFVIDECEECLISNTSIGISSWNTIGIHYMYFFFLDELRKFTICISDFPKQIHLGYTLITLFFSYTL